MNVSDVKDLADRMRAEIGKAVVGQADTVELMLTALMAGGHVLLEGPPGTAKTFLAQCFARTLDLEFGRIQFTPDLMPGDIIGANLFNFQTSTFTLTRGPIFCELLLADEINRTPPKTQAALLEAMQERNVTIDGQTPPAQRPLHGGGDPEPDRAAGHLSAAGGPARPLPVQADAEIPERGGGARHRRRPRRCAPAAPIPADMGVGVAADRADLAAAAAAIAGIRLAPTRSSAMSSALVRATRETPDLETGASPRSAAMLATAARARAALRGPRLCDPRRRQGAGPAGAAPPGDPLAGGRDRGPARSTRSSRA